MAISPPPAFLLLALACAAPVCGQERGALERRVENLEEDGRRKDARIRELERRVGDHTAGAQEAPERRGIGGLGQTTIFDNTFNPALSLVADFVLSVDDRDDNFESSNQFTLRDVELGVAGRVDPLLSYQLYVHFSEDDIELEEAYLLADSWLPDTFQLKAGRFNLDFGKLAPIHDHDLPFLDKPQVLQEYLGGMLRGTGLELHHDFGVGEATLVRWVVGVVNEFDGDAHSIFGPAAGHEHDHDEAPEPFGDRDFENFGFNARLSALTEIGDGTLQVGGSIAYAPETRTFFMSGANVISADLELLTLGVDVTLKNLAPDTGRGLAVGVELLRTQNDHSDDGLAITQVTSDGLYGYVEWVADSRWSFGASGGWFEHAEDNALNSWDAGAFVTHRLNEFNRLRLEARHFDDPGTDSLGAALQWTIILGSHGHGIDW